MLPGNCSAIGSKFPPDADTWWAINGEPIEPPDERLMQMHGHVHAHPEPDFLIAVKVTNPPAHGLRRASPCAEAA